MKVKNLFLAIVAMGCSLYASAQTAGRSFYIDYGQYNVSGQGFVTGTDKNGNVWNNIHGKGTGAPDKAYPQTINLVSSDGTESKYQLQLSYRFSTNGYTNGGLLSPSESLLGDMAIATATEDYIFLESNQDYGVIRYKGLDKNKAYRFYSFGSRQDTSTREATFIFRGLNTWKGDHTMGGSGIGNGGYNGNNNNIQESDLIFPDENGCIEMTIVKKNKSGMVHLNAQKIVEYTDVTRPDLGLTLTRKMLIDFGENGKASTRGEFTTSPDVNGNYWNNMGPKTSGTSAVVNTTKAEIVTVDNQSTDITLVNNQQVNANGYNNGGLTNPSADDLGELAISTATGDYMYSENNTVGKMTFKGLDTQKLYRFSIFGTRSDASNFRTTVLTLTGTTTWQTVQCTSGPGIGGDGVNQNVRNIAVSDYLSPDDDGTIVFTFTQNTAPSSTFGHISVMRVEEFDGGTPIEKPVTFSTLTLTGNAEDATFNQVPGNSYQYQAFAKMTTGTYTISGTDSKGKEYTLGSTADGYSYDSTEAFTVGEDCVAWVVVNTQDKTVTCTPVTMNLRGNMGAASGYPAIAYKGDGVFESEVTIKDSSDPQYVNKTMYFALNNSESYAIKRLQGASTRYALGMSAYGQATEDIYQNYGTYTITVDMNKMVYDITAPIDEYRISVFGSSVANGQGATNYQGYRYLYGQQLINRYESGKSEYPFYTTNVSIGGNTTTLLMGRYDDVIRDCGRYVIFGLSLGNEGIHGASNQEAVFKQWRDNMLKLITMVREDGRIPMVMNNYTRADFTESDYAYVKKLNMLIHQWDVPSTNVLGAIDNGHGQWADGYKDDDYHPTTNGHHEFMYAMVPSLYDALKAEKPQPVRDLTKSMTLENGNTITFDPEGTTHSFTLSVRVKRGEGQIAMVKTPTKKYVVSMDAEGFVICTTINGDTLKSTKAITDDEWHNITLTNYYAQKRTLLYVDKTSVGEVSDHGVIRHINIGDDSKSRDFSEISFWRSGMSPEEVEGICDGLMLKSSLEIYAPLGGADDMANLAQCTNTLTYVPAAEDYIASLQQSADKSRQVDGIYNLKGQRLNETSKGVYIIGGKKVAIK